MTKVDMVHSNEDRHDLERFEQLRREQAANAAEEGRSFILIHQDLNPRHCV